MNGFSREAMADSFGTALVRACIPLVAALRRRGVDATQAEDLAQEACLRALEHRERFDSDRPLLPWLLVIALRRRQDQLRRRAPEMKAPPVELVGPEEAAVLREEQGRLDRAMACLAPVARKIVVAFYRHGRGVAAIAAEMEMSAASVKSHLHRARAALAQALRER